MARPPTVDADTVREIVCVYPRPTAAQAAQQLTELLGRPISESLVTMMIHRHRHEWPLGEPPSHGGSRPKIAYQHERDLPIVSDDHPWLRRHLACWERIMSRSDRIPETEYETTVDTWVRRLVASGRVVDVDDGEWITRFAWPWELGKLWRQPRPSTADARSALASYVDRGDRFLIDTPWGEHAFELTHDHKRFWRTELDRTPEVM